MDNKLKLALKEIKYFLLDMDGTIYIDNYPIGDMINTLDFLRENGKQIIYITNNSSKSVSAYIEKLKAIDFYRDGDIIYSSTIATAQYIKKYYNGKLVHALATNSVKQELLDSGINLTNSTNCDIALLTYDTELNYEKLCNFVKALNNGAKYIATHPDACCPSKEVFLPDAGSFIKMIEVSNGYLPEIIIGKPYTTMGEVLKNKFSNEVGKFIMVGDRLHTDIQFGINCGFHTLLVMSGETDENTKNTSLIKAEFVLNTLNDIKKYF